MRAGLIQTDYGLLAGMVRTNVPAAASVPDPEVQPTMSVDETAAAFRVGRTTVYEAVKSGEIPSVRFSGRILIPTAVVRRMLHLDPDAA
jgi:excisionase family DNA binding protein